MSNYRSESGCLKCGHFWVTRKRNTTKPPARCPKCGSSKTYVARCFKTDEKQVFDNYEKMMEKMFKKYMKDFRERGD